MLSAFLVSKIKSFTNSNYCEEDDDLHLLYRTHKLEILH